MMMVSLFFFHVFVQFHFLAWLRGSVDNPPTHEVRRFLIAIILVNCHSLIHCQDYMILSFKYLLG